MLVTFTPTRSGPLHAGRIVRANVPGKAEIVDTLSPAMPAAMLAAKVAVRIREVVTPYRQADPFQQELDLDLLDIGIRRRFGLSCITSCSQTRARI